MDTITVDNGLLTRDEDTIFKIMLHMDIVDLSSFCQAGKVANELCHNQYFWRLKFKQDDLPIIKPFSYHTNYSQEYQLTKIARNNAGLVVKIEDIEHQRDKSKWLIRI